MKLDNPGGTRPIYICDFCGMSDAVDQSHCFVCAEDNIAICGACVDRSAEIVKEHRAREAARSKEQAHG